LTLVK